MPNLRLPDNPFPVRVYSMSLLDDEPIYDFVDKAMRDALRQPDNLRALLSQVVPDLIDGFDFGRMQVLPREFLFDDWRSRECDLLIEIPYRSVLGEQITLICILLEHQSSIDFRMPLRTFVYAGQYWDRQLRQWQTQTPPRPNFQLPPLLPIILYTGITPWNTNRTLNDLIGGPEAVRVFAPRWEPIIWELNRQSPDQLLNTNEAFLSVLAVMRLEEADRIELSQVFEQTVKKIESLHGSNRVRWYDLLKLVLTWVAWRRPEPERRELWNMADVMDAQLEYTRRLRAMQKEIAESFRREGREEGRAEALRTVLLIQGKKRFGPPPEGLEERMNQIEDPSRFQPLIERILDLTSWDEIAAAFPG